MSYFSTDSGGLGEFSCGADCSCKQCRSNLAEVYEEEEIPETAPSKAAPKIGAWFGSGTPFASPPARSSPWSVPRVRNKLSGFSARRRNGTYGWANRGLAGYRLSESLTQLVPPACKPEPGEVAASRTPAGILTKDIEIIDKGVLITDFGIDWRSVKDGAKSELASLIHRLETDPMIAEIRIHGFDDCVGPGGPRYHMWLRKERALRVRNLLGPVARSKLKFVGPAPLGSFIGPNTDRAARARNRSVLIEFHSQITFEPEPPIPAKPCHEQLIRRALRQLRDDQNLDSKIKSRLGAALGTALAGRDDSFIRPGSTSLMFPFRWSGIAEYFRELCNQPGSAAALSASGLARKLMELDQDIINGLDSFKRARQQFSSIFNKKAALEADFGRRLEALFKNKAQTVYAEY
jgi:outer membrane protein OmpA-like peptidoglycan-associated protein